jgi:SAM-dependent methyltransferase
MKGTVEDIKEYFTEPTEGNHPEQYALDIERSVYLVRVIERLFPNKNRFKILELGSNVGRNLYYLKKAGYSVEGIEGSRTYFDSIPKFFPDVIGLTHFGQIEQVLHEDNLLLDRFDLIFTMAVLEHIPPEIEDRVFIGIKKRTKWLLTIEDEKCDDWKHFPRNYQKVIEQYDFEVKDSWNYPPLGLNFVMRLFRRL